MKNAAFMTVELENLQETIAAEGATDDYKNGANQYGRKISAALQSYNSLLKNYTAVIKALLTILPPGERPEAAAALQPQPRTDYETQKQLEAERAARINAEISAAAAKQAKERAEAELKRLQAG